LARSRKRSRWRRIPIVVPVLAVATVVILYALFSPPSQGHVVLDFSEKISIQVSEHLSNGTNVIRYFTPPRNGIGVPGGIWRADTYTSYGASRNYPIFMLPATSTTYIGYSLIYVKSTVNRTYTLGDLFSVWGERLGRNNTLGFTTPPPSGQTTFPSTWYWDMCVGPSQGSMHEGLWGNETLAPSKNIILLYSNFGCLG
jgi:hypothetical protein